MPDDRYARYQRLQFDWPAPRVLRIRMNNPGKLNAADQIMHGELGTIWRDVDEDPNVSAVLLTGVAKAKYYLLLCDALSGEEAERIGLVSLAVEDSELDAKALEIATRLADGPPSAIRWTKYTLNNWLRQMGPSFDASLALEFLGFTGPEAREGVAAFKEKRKADFPKDSPA